MAILIAGLVIFLSIHTLTTLRETRAGLIGRLGENGYKGLYSLTAGVGLVLIYLLVRPYKESGELEVKYSAK